MCIYHLSVKVISRSGGRSATGAAAYRSGTDIKDERTDRTFRYAKRHGVEWTEILLPEGAPERFSDRCVLWNEVESTEKRRDAQVAREIEVSLPVELNSEQQRKLIKSYIKDEFVSRGMIADIAMHKTDPLNPHCHVMLTTREVNRDGFGRKNRDWNNRELVVEWREKWAEYANRALEQAGIDARIDHRSLKAQGVERIPTVFLSPAVIAMEQRGERTERGTAALVVDELNQRIEARKEKHERRHERTYENSAGTQSGAAGSRDGADQRGVGAADRGDAAGKPRDARGDEGRGRSDAARDRRGAEEGAGAWGSGTRGAFSRSGGAQSERAVDVSDDFDGGGVQFSGWGGRGGYCRSGDAEAGNSEHIGSESGRRTLNRKLDLKKLVKELKNEEIKQNRDNDQDLSL